MKQLWNRARWPVAVALVVLIAAAIAALTVHRGDSARLSPENPAPNGARALAQVLGQQGVGVTQVRRSPAVVEADGPDATIVVTDTGLLGPAQLRRLARTQANLVLVEPDEYTLSVLAPQIRTAGTVDAQVRAPACSDQDSDADTATPRAAGDALAGGQQYRFADLTYRDDAVVCYPTAPAASDPSIGSYLTITEQGRSVVVIGQGDLMTNEHLGERGNATLALRTLGTQPRLIWYTPDPLELGQADNPPTLRSLLPRWVFWVIVQLIVTSLVVMLWRARRLGGLVPEPLPVVVRSAETQEGRARLYRQASARGRAAATLRSSTLRRLSTRLAAPAGTSPEQLVGLVAAATGRDEATLQALLLGGTPESDGALVTLADELDAVEKDMTTSKGRL